MRTFIAIELPKVIKDYLSSLQNQLKEFTNAVKWVEPGNIHLTLKFLGEIDDAKVIKITDIINNIALANNAYTIRLSSLGAFPKINFARVIWVGIDAGEAETKQIAKVLEERIEKIGIPKENRAFSSHITIGRVRSPSKNERFAAALNDLSKNFAENNLEFKVTKLTLFKSTLTPHGPVYETLQEANLTTI